MQIHVQARVHPTEDLEKVQQAVRNIFPKVDFQVSEIGEAKYLLSGKADGLEPLEAIRDLLRRQQIRGAARSVFFAGLRGNTIRVHLNKQVAFVNKVSFCSEEGESPLGPITLEVDARDAIQVIDLVAPSTRSPDTSKM